VLGARKGVTTRVELVAACFVPAVPCAVRVARLVGGVRALFDTVRYRDDAGKYIAETTLFADEVALPVTGETDVVCALFSRRHRLLT
jgi:hypothetical protein